MKDERDELLDELFGRARLLKPDTAHLEEHFETRLMATLAERKRECDLWTAWAYRLVPWFAVMVIVVGIGNYAIDPAGSGDPFSTFMSSDDDYQITSMIAGG
jgi:hypothetical protein